MTRQRFLRNLATVAFLAAVYFVAGKLGLKLAQVHPSATAVWAPAGIALAAFLILGYGVFPGVLLGAFLVNLTTAGSVATSIGIAVGNTLEGLLGAYLVNELANGRNAFGRAQDIFRFAVLAGIISTTVSATFGVTSLCLGGFANWDDFGAIWLTWWLGDAVGVLVLAPLLVLWSASPPVKWNSNQAPEAALMLLALLLVAHTVFGGLFAVGTRNYPLEFLCIPFLVWAAFRFGQRLAATAISLLAVIAVWGTLQGLGPFVRKTQNESLLLLQAFMGITSVMILAVAALVEERKQSEKTATHLAAIVQSSDDAIIGKSLDGMIVSWNAGAERIYGHTAAEAIGRPISMLVPPDRADEVPQLLERLKRGERIEHFETVRRSKGGEPLHISLSISPVKDASGAIIGASAIARDVSERKRNEEALQQANAVLTGWLSELEKRTHETTLLNEMGDLLQTCVAVEEAYAVIARFAQQLFPTECGALCVLNASQNLVEAVAVWGDSPACERVFTPEECWALRRGQLHAVDDPASGLICQHVGEPVPVGYLCVPMMGQGEALGVLHLQCGNASNDPVNRLSEAKRRLAVTAAGQLALALANLRLRETLRMQSIRDPLTGLFNRRYMEESLARELRRAGRNQRRLGIMMLDLDHFKRFNDTHGHEAGDTLLRELGEFLRTRTRREDIACRYGGEEFVLVLPEATIEVTRQRGERLRDEFKRLNVQHRGQSLGAVSLSIGVAVFPDHGLTVEDLLRASDQALYRAKAEGRNRVVLGERVE